MFYIFFSFSFFVSLFFLCIPLRYEFNSRRLCLLYSNNIFYRKRTSFFHLYKHGNERMVCDCFLSIVVAAVWVRRFCTWFCVPFRRFYSVNCSTYCWATVQLQQRIFILFSLLFPFVSQYESFDKHWTQKEKKKRKQIQNAFGKFTLWNSPEAILDTMPHLKTRCNNSSDQMLPMDRSRELRGR